MFSTCLPEALGLVITIVDVIRPIVAIHWSSTYRPSTLWVQGT